MRRIGRVTGRNKRNETWRPGAVATALALCALFVLLGVGYVWYKNQVDLLGHLIKERETRLAELQRENKVRRDQLAMLCSPVYLEARVKKLNLGLGPPAKSQIVWMVEIPVVQQTAAQPPRDGRQARAVLAEGKE